MDSQREASTQALDREKQALQAEMGQLEKQHRSNLLRFNFGEYLQGVAKRGIWPFGDNVLLVIAACVFRLVLVLIFFSVTQNWIAAAAIYGVLHLAALIVGSRMSARASARLTVIDGKATEVTEKFLHNCEKRYQINVYIGAMGIASYSVDFGDDITLLNNYVSVSMKRDTPDISFYNLNNGDEFSGFIKRTSSLSDGEVELTRHFASTQFNKKFGVVMDYGDEISAVSFLSPAIQMKMINTPEIQQMSALQIKSGCFTAQCGDFLTAPELARIDRFQSLNGNLERIEEWCRNIRTQADKAHTTMEKLDFIYR